MRKDRNSLNFHERRVQPMNKMRGTSHNGRFGKNGTYSPKHNDRNFDLSKADHIDPNKTNGNWYWHLYMQNAPNATFEEVEDMYYTKAFGEALNAKNERYRADGHKERMRTMDEYRKSKQSCPEETIYQIGKAGETVDPETLKRICLEHMRWEEKTFPNVRILNVALHVDEEGAPHMHERKVWLAESKDGMIVGQAKALDAMGIVRPHPKKAKSRTNNAKVTYTAMCRNHFLETCKEHGLQIEEQPDKASKRGLELEEYKRLQECEKTKIAIMEAKQAQLEKAAIDNAIEDAYKNLEKAQAAITQMDNKAKELEDVQQKINVANDQLKKVLDLKAKASEVKKIFREKDTVTYHKNMLDSTRAIGNNAKQVLEEAQAKEMAITEREIQLRKREALLDKAEKEIAPLYAEAVSEMEKATQAKEDIDNLILQRAKKLVKSMDWRPTDMSDKMEQYMSKYNINGKSLDKLFYEDLAHQVEKREKALEDKYYNRHISNELER